VHSIKRCGDDYFDKKRFYLASIERPCIDFFLYCCFLDPTPLYNLSYGNIGFVDGLYASLPQALEPHPIFYGTY
jgi:hypothetical protein